MNHHHHHDASHPEQPVTKKLKSVVMDETQNQTHTIHHHHESTDLIGVSHEARKLLQEAEERHDHPINRSHNDIDTVVMNPLTSSIPRALTALFNAVETNRQIRDQFISDKGDDDDTAALQHYKDGHIMESEVNLYEHVRAWKSIAVDPVRYYPLLLQQQTPQQSSCCSIFEVLGTLLCHPNVDMVVAVVSLIHEWFDVMDHHHHHHIDDHNNTVHEVVRSLAHELITSGVAEGTIDAGDRFRNHSNDNHDDNDDDDDDVGRGMDDLWSLWDHWCDLDSATRPIHSRSTNTNGSTNSTTTSIALQLCQHTRIISFLFYLQELPNDSLPHDDETDEIIAQRHRAMELLLTLTTREELYTLHPYHNDWTRLPPYHPQQQHHPNDTTTTTTNNTTTTTTTNNTTTTTTNNTNTEPSTHIDAIEILLQIVGPYRKRPPGTYDAMEYLQHTCLVMTSLLTYSSACVTAFLERQGIELVLRCWKERVVTGALTMEWLDFSSGSEVAHVHACESMVQVGVLKYLFPFLMGQHLPKYSDSYNDDDDDDRNDTDTTTLPTKRKHQQRTKRKLEFYQKIEATTIRILYGLVRHLRAAAPHQVQARLLAKFMDHDQKVQRLVDLYFKYDEQVRLAEYKFYQSDIEDVILDSGEGSLNDDDDKDSLIQFAVLETKLNAGGDILYRLAAIIAFCCVSSKKCHTWIIEHLQTKQSGISVIKETLYEFISMLDVTSDQRILLQTFHDQI